MPDLYLIPEFLFIFISQYDAVIITRCINFTAVHIYFFTFISFFAFFFYFSLMIKIAIIIYINTICMLSYFNRFT